MEKVAVERKAEQFSRLFFPVLQSRFIVRLFFGSPSYLLLISTAMLEGMRFLNYYSRLEKGKHKHERKNGIFVYKTSTEKALFAFTGAARKLRTT